MMHQFRCSGGKEKTADGLRRAPCALSLSSGFTLLELVVVLFIVVLGF
jgi:general secretion pathway protein H